MFLRRSLVSAGALVVAISHVAHAQSVDYGQLEQLFGEPVTTSATGSPQKAADAPANMEIISADDIRRTGADNIPDILNRVSGIDVRRYALGDTEVAIRGYNQTFSPRLLVLINGRQVYLDSYGYTAWETLPVQLDEIRQIEIVKGPASALFGFNAVAGVINIITYDPLSDNVKAATVRGGTQSDGSASAVGTFHLGNDAGLRISAGGYRASEFSTGSLRASSGPYYTEPHSRELSVDGRYKPTSNTEISAELTSSYAHNYEEVSSYLPTDAVYRTNSFKLGFAADTDFGLANLSAYRNETRYDVKLNSGGVQGDPVSLMNDVYVVQASDLFKLGADNAIRVGLEYRNNSENAQSINGTIGYEVYAASAMWNWQISPELSLTNALRVDYLSLNRTDPVVAGSPFSVADYNNASITEPSFNTGLVYKPTDLDTVRLLVGRGVQAPNLTAFGTQYLVPLGSLHLVEVGNPNLDASTIMNYEVDYDRSIPALYSTINTSVYYQNTQSVLAVSYSLSPQFIPPASLYAQAENIGHSRAAGGEIELKGAKGGFRWNLGYALSVVTDHLDVSSSGNPSPTAIEFQHATPTNAVTFGLGYDWGKFETDVYGKWQSSFKDYTSLTPGSNTPIIINDYITTNAHVGYKVTDYLTLGVTAQQFNDARIATTSGVPTERRVIVSATIHN